MHRHGLGCRKQTARAFGGSTNKSKHLMARLCLFSFTMPLLFSKIGPTLLGRVSSYDSFLLEG